MSWRPAKSLVVLRDQINQAYPNRSKASDGLIDFESIRWYTGDMTHCKIKECQKKLAAKGWCKSHYDAWRRTGLPNTYVDPIEKAKLTLWQRIQQIGWTENDNGCKEYNGFRNENGYGQYRYQGKLHRIHRVAYKELIGQLDDKEVIMHICDNPACSEITHLRKGSQVENIKDMWAKNRAHGSDLKTCVNGHEYPSDRPRAINKNRCRQCANERTRRYLDKKKLSV